MAASGFVLSVLNIGSPGAFTSTSYGQTLLLKVAAVAGVAALGWFNWRTHSREGFDSARLRRRAAFECLLALVVVLGLTAWLGGLEIPAA
jgi:putative copper export protein